MEDVAIIGTGAQEWAERRVVVTGAAGLLGSWLATALADAGTHVVGLDLKALDVQPPPGARFELVQGDVRDADVVGRLLADANADTVFHLAAQSLVGPANDRPVETFEHNVVGTWTVLDACRRLPSVRSVIVASSDKAYGDTGGEPYVETMPLTARHPYEVSKACADLIAQSYAQTYAVPVGISRCANLYGGGDTNWSRIVPDTIRAAIAGRRPVVRSDGRYVRDFLYIEDAVTGLLALAEAVGRRSELAGHAFNFAAGDRLSVLQIVRKILALMQCDLEPEIRDEARHEIREQRLETGKARSELGWHARFSLEEGLGRTIEWYRQHVEVAR